MKKILLTSLLVLAPLTSQADTGPGCGWGAILFEGKDGVVSNVLAATTNGISGNQTFGMTTGTGGCDASKPVTLSAADIFLDANMERVARDMATGNGEALSTLAELMGVKQEDKGAFFKATQESFAKIFTNDAVSSQEIVASIREVMSDNQTLSKYLG